MKLPLDLLSSPELAAAGRDGGWVYLAALTQHHHHGEAGLIPPRNSTAHALQIRLVVLGFTEADVGPGLESCFNAGLLSREADGGLRIVPWDERYAVQCSKCRTLNHAPRYSLCARCRGKRDPDREGTPEEHRKSTGGTDRRTDRQTNGHRAHAHARDDGGGQQPPAPPAGAAPDRSAPPGAPDTAAAAAGSEGFSERSKILGVLHRARFAGLPGRLRAADDLTLQGFTEDQVESAWQLAQRKSAARKDGKQNPGGLFATWIRDGLLRSVLDEEAAKQKHQDLRAKHKAAMAAAEAG